MQTWQGLPVVALAVVASSGLPRNTAQGSGDRQFTWFWKPAKTTICIAGLYLAGHSGVHARVDARVASVLKSLTQQKLSEDDAEMLERGYYENLTGVERFNSQLWEMYSKRPVSWGNLRDAGGMRYTNDFLVEELIPLLDIPFKGTTLRTNRWGMRDDDYERQKPTGIRRIAVLGPSDTMGSGVTLEQTFASVLEQHLNKVADDSRYEVLNFGTSNYTPPQHLRLLEERALQFDPDVVIFVAHDEDAERSVRHLRTVLNRRVEIPYEPLRQIVRAAGVTPGMNDEEIRRRLRPVREQVLGWTLHRIGEICRERGITVVWLFLPFLVEQVEPIDPALLKHARDSSFAIVDLSDIYEGKDIGNFKIADGDTHHPNVAGHAMIAERLHRALREITRDAVR